MRPLGTQRITSLEIGFAIARSNTAMNGDKAELNAVTITHQ